MGARAIARHTPWLRYATGNWWELVPFVDHDQDARKALAAAKAWCRSHGYRIDYVLPPVRDGESAPWRLCMTKNEVRRSGD